MVDDAVCARASTFNAVIALPRRFTSVLVSLRILIVRILTTAGVHRGGRSNRPGELVLLTEVFEAGLYGRNHRLTFRSFSDHFVLVISAGDDLCKRTLWTICR